MYFRRTSRAELPATPAAEPDVKVRLELLRETYKEVLDAVKHQDDKIGRLLTGLAFLTAATLAVAGLGGAEFVTRTFDVGVVAVPLAVVFLGGFVIGMVLAVSLLLAAFSAPLRLPGQIPEGSSASGSSIYFFEIVRQSRDEWQRKMSSGSAKEDQRLLEERANSLAKESHNLAARATYKHERVTEATAVVVTALLGLALATVFTLIAASAPDASEENPPALPITSTTAWTLAIVIALSTALQFHSRMRNERQTVDDGKKQLAPAVLYAAAVSGGLLALVADLDRLLIALAGGVAFFVELSRLRHEIRRVHQANDEMGKATMEPVPSIVQDALDKLARRRRGLFATARAFAVTTAAAIVAVAASSQSDYGWRLLVAVCLYGLLALSSLIGPTFDAERRMRQGRMREARAKEHPCAPE